MWPLPKNIKRPEGTCCEPVNTWRVNLIWKGGTPGSTGLLSRSVIIEDPHTEASNLPRPHSISLFDSQRDWYQVSPLASFICWTHHPSIVDFIYTLVSYYQVQLSQWADLLCSSLLKWISAVHSTQHAWANGPDLPCFALWLYTEHVIN